jgi:hypothetical protein
LNSVIGIKENKLGKHHWFAFLVVLYVVTLAIFSQNGLHYPYGDGPEYSMMTESFLNHGSPELRAEDVDGYLNYLRERKLPIQNADAFLAYQKKFNKEVHYLKGYYQSTTDLEKWFSYHFWFYSMLNVPARYFLSLIDADIKITFLCTNLFMIFLGIWLITQLKKTTLKDKVFLCLLMTFSPLLWYVDWAHAEVFCGVLVFLGAIYHYYKLFYAAIICFVIASLQNQAITILAFLVSIEVLYREKITFPLLLKLFLCNVWTLAPSLFYYYWFEVFSLLSTDGTISYEGISLKRFWHFFFDLNQGLIYGIPFVLLFALILILIDVSRLKKFREYTLLLAIPFMALLFMQVTNWNSGNVVIKRYGVWIAPLFIVAFYFRIKRFKTWAFYLIAVLAALSQPLVIFSQHDFNQYYWHANNLKPIAKWVLDRHPAWYNPEPEVLLERMNTSNPASTDSVIVYQNHEGKVTKMFVKQGALKQLITRGVSPRTVDSLEKKLTYHLGIAQLNPRDLKAIRYKQENDPFLMRSKAQDHDQD